MMNKFVHWYNDVFKQTQLYADMQATREGTPWHREHSVAVHTDMVVMEYLMRVERNGVVASFAILGALAAAFHDVGKPGTRQEKWKEERGYYNSFNGHEQLSARLWENWACENWQSLVDTFKLAPEDIYTIGFMILMHKPWDLKKTDKLNAMALTLAMTDVSDIFYTLVLADTWGRISDDQTEKRTKVEHWLDEFEKRRWSMSNHSAVWERENPNSKPVMYVPIAASGSGKSTLLKRMHELDTTMNVFSLDLMRLELYDDDYATAFQKSTKDKHFRATCNNRYRDLLRENKNMFLDNTNTSKKNRRFYLDEARRRGYHLVAVLLPVSLQVIIDRQTSRGDKNVPVEAVKRQYDNLQLPQFLEFDDIQVVDTNL